MAELISMRKTPTEMKSTSDGCATPCDVNADPYPYGMEIRLEKESLAKLGDQADLLSVGATVTITAEAKVERMSVQESDGEDSRADATLQITKLSIDGTVGSGKTLRDFRRLINSK